MFETLTDIWKERKLIIVLSQADFKKKFVGSYLGIFWMFVQPIISILIYYLVFQVGFKTNPVDDMPYVLWLMPGIFPWFFFNEALQGGVLTLSSYQYLVKKIVFKVDILPMVKIVSSLFLHLIFLYINIFVYLLWGEYPSIWWLQSIYYLFCNLTLIIGLVYLTAAINVFVKDMSQIVNICLQFGFWLAPIMWDESIMPDMLRPFLKINPFTYIVNGFRDSFVFHIGFWERPVNTAYFWGISMLILLSGVKLYKRMEPHFADML
ncbi:MAG TPA: ABC transporter permease [Candidatus Eisenbergiella merdavium]|uniref:Transport permease protein n=1 Tax=Candidatus Eisenbergiella merdavium TaxID=2838551 RepID=A0A9D2NJK3_9FIRM|nr:ABC transporter permease [Candidatus Eisenbergiella merdavium]